MGIYCTYQFSGEFFGGIMGVLSYKLVASSGLFLCLTGLMMVWFILSIGMHNPSRLVLLRLHFYIYIKHKRSTTSQYTH